MTAVIRVADHGRFLATRASGCQIREAAEALTPGGLLILDFAGVEAMTWAFADELAGKLIASGRDVACRGMSEDVRETLEVICRRRDLEMPC